MTVFAGHRGHGAKAQPQAQRRPIVRQKNPPSAIREWLGRYEVERLDKGLDDKVGGVEGVGAGDVERAVLEHLVRDGPKNFVKESKMDPLRIQSYTAQMADHIRRIPRNPFLAERESVDAWTEEARGLIDTVFESQKTSPFKAGKDPRLKDVWRQLRAHYKMLMDLEEYINYDRYFTNHQGYMANELNVFTTHEKTFTDVLDEVEDGVENPPYSNTHGTAAHQKYMETLNQFNDKWQDEVFDAGAEE